jgi:hypothetical protein
VLSNRQLRVARLLVRGLRSILSAQSGLRGAVADSGVLCCRGLVKFERGNGGLEASRFLIKADTHFGSSGEECGEDETNEGCGGGNSAENPLHGDALDHEAESKEGEGEPEAEELSDESARAVDGWILIEAHGCADDCCDREEPGEKPNSEETEYILRRHGPKSLQNS